MGLSEKEKRAIAAPQTNDHAACIRCQGKNRDGRPCKKWAINGTSFCRFHGGAQAGVLNARFKTGRYSKYLPNRLRTYYEHAFTDQNLLHQNEEIALLESRLADLLLRVDTGESGYLWRETQKAYFDLRKAMNKGDRDKVTDALADLEVLIERGHADYQAWGEVQRVLESRRRIIESERKRIEAAGNYLTTHQAMTLIQALIMSVKSHVSDRDALKQIQADISRILGSTDGMNIRSEDIPGPK